MCKGDIVVVDIKQHKSLFKNSNFTITVSKVLLTKRKGKGKKNEKEERRGRKRRGKEREGGTTIA